ncbi:MAG: dihydrofolate reductase [Quisquiliibacterium sp.]
MSEATGVTNESDGSPRPRVTIVVARARNGVIGRDNALAWRLPEDLAHFRATTLGHPLIMGRRTFESIGRPLPGRRTIIVTRDPGWTHPGCERAASVHDAIELAGTPGDDPKISCDEAMIVGGGQIYAEAMPLADRIVLTEIDGEFQGDTWFDAPNPASWELVQRREAQSATGLAYAICEYRRRPTG